ncbi:Uncharacterised protein [Shigella sonnei]|uniref:Uncharacterized protein n=1 Tax=Shigella sonnei TaxID=624 RepID=A0A0I4X595_SHISO|nr:Uncharacterised protein [Shigella sonnei]CSE40329.1 Uncharacterised protein [Shigella sonnei]CSE44471.1 Uncharacterised protein [Shigella sonnei]CSE45738.1 Uncharacterised protein [Shigella sonnei]CSE47472.1 Uncharacterised protein [Shigella sonnei]
MNWAMLSVVLSPITMLARAFTASFKNFRLREWYTDTTIGQNSAF